MKPSGEAEWTEVLHTSIDELKSHGFEVVRNRGKLPPFGYSFELDHPFC